jgi:mxaJ protein
VTVGIRFVPRRRARRWAGALGGAVLLGAVAGASLVPATPLQERVLRVCADPNNLPYSNDRLEGFENKIAELVARELGAKVAYTWWPQRRGFIRNTLRQNLCDVVMGVPQSYELVLTTRPYYRSTYVFLYRADAPFEIHSLDDSILRTLRIGVHVIGDDYNNSPPAHALGARGIVRNVKGYSVYGDYSEPNPPSEIVYAVARGEVDVAIVWGPIAGYFAKQQPVPMKIVPVSPTIDLPFLPMVYDISMGVRRTDEAFRDTLDEIIVRRHDEIRAILEEYGVPMLKIAGRS